MLPVTVNVPTSSPVLWSLVSAVLLVTENVAAKLAEFVEVPAVEPVSLLFRLVVWSKLATSRLLFPDIEILPILEPEATVNEVKSVLELKVKSCIVALIDKVSKLPSSK